MVNIQTKKEILKKCKNNHIEMIDQYIDSRTKIKFRCHCGNYFYSAPRNKLISCGCIKIINNRGWKGYGEISGNYFSVIRNGAKKRNLEFDITIEYIWNLFLKQNKKCALTGMKLFFVRNTKMSPLLKTASLDRIDNNQGYIKGNLQWIHKTINIMKLNMIQKDFVKWCNLVSNNNSC